MDALQDPALRPLILTYVKITLLSLGIFIVVTMLAWKSNMAVLADLRHRWKLRFNQAYRQRHECLERYQSHCTAMTVLGAMVRRLAHELQEQARDPVQSPVFVVIHGNYRAACLEAADYFSKLPEADIDILKVEISRAWEMRVPQETIAAFLRAERALAVSNPGGVPEHVSRLIKVLAAHVPELVSPPE